MACAATLASGSVAIAQQPSQQTPTQSSATRPPDPARSGPTPVHSKKSVLCMKTAYIGCHEADFHFEVAICIALGCCPVCNETLNALRSNSSSIDSCGIITVPGDARLRQ